MQFMAFDYGPYTRGTARRGDGVDYDVFRRQPLSPGGLRCLRHLCDLCHPHDLLVAPAHTEPTDTAILTRWIYEKDWHREVLAKVLTAHNVPTGTPPVTAAPCRIGRRGRRGPARWALRHGVSGDDATAIRMTWGAINEWMTHSCYHRLVLREEHPVLTDVLHRVTSLEMRHAAYYAGQAHDRLAHSARVRRLTRFALRHFWAPADAARMPRVETSHLMRYLLADEAGWQEIRQLDDRIERLPGLAGLGLVRRALRRYGVVDPSTRRA
ncbi:MULTISPECIES: hypothetical protein [unclassified Micromonospora]|uniref:hypothetical protein n=1 Tax=unclassified Micromonospora TaxID=2617518 RepID=UPI001C220193|nr:MULTISPECIES: hypothetical protein [unclassified Micromonospora]MBU8855833.1 hypothetical protein [Micromonospora sp. WMMB482]MBU8861853.1 hypothetical protein [Micromonospora sp. WMMB482]MDM4781434.1 hypothetical protein [Micromonospora sp. b486]